MADWRDRRVPEFRAYLRDVLGREPTERDYAAAVMQLEQRGPGSVAVGHAFRNRLATEGGDPSSHLRHYDPVALGHRWREITPQAIDRWGGEYDKITAGEGPLRPGQTHFFSPAGMQAYYNKDPSMVRSAVRMTVPGHGEVLVPNWATKAVAAGDFTPVNGEWFLTPNERYGQAVADSGQRPASEPVSPPAANVGAPDASSAPTRTSSPEPDLSFGDKRSPIDAAMRIAKAVAPSQQQGDGLEPVLQPVASTIPRFQMAQAPIPYQGAADQALRLASGGRADDDAKPHPLGAGRFAAPQIAPPPDDTPTRRLINTLAGTGRMPYADGGGINDTGMNVPEAREALLAQQKQLIEGRRPAQMFPRGTQELPLPRGLDRVETPRGVFHFDPSVITADEIIEASAAGRENELLGLGPLNKDDVAGIMAETGERPVAVTERDPQGNEVRASMATPSTVGIQADDMLRSMGDGHNNVDVEPVGDVLAGRGDGTMSRASGGGINTGAPVIGAIMGSTGGRADKVPGTALSGSHVISADIVSHMGQGNTMAGMKALEKMFRTGPYGMPLRRGRRGGFADGGEIADDTVPVMVSDGEFVVPPDVVAEIGGGDVQAGHDILDAWILDERQRAIETLQALPPPATD